MAALPAVRCTPPGPEVNPAPATAQVLQSGRGSQATHSLSGVQSLLLSLTCNPSVTDTYSPCLYCAALRLSLTPNEDGNSTRARGAQACSAASETLHAAEASCTALMQWPPMVVMALQLCSADFAGLHRQRRDLAKLTSTRSDSLRCTTHQVLCRGTGNQGQPAAVGPV